MWWTRAARARCAVIGAGSGTLRESELVDAHDELPALTNDEVLALQLRQVLGDSGPRSPDEIGNVLVAERCFQKRAARLFDSEIGSQFKQGNGNAFMKIEVQEAGAAQQQPVALLQIVLMKCLEGRFGAMCRKTFESAPAQTADSAIIVSLHRKSNRPNGSKGNSGIGPGGSREMVTRSPQAFWQVMRAMPFNRM